MRIIFFILLIVAVVWGVTNISKSVITPAPIITLSAPVTKPSPSPPPSPFDRSKISVLLNVPFTPQAPFANWKDLRQEDGCEETSALMAVYWAKDQTLTRQQALEVILAISEYEEDTYGTYVDTSAKDTAERIIKGYFKYTNYRIINNVSLDDLVTELAAGNVLIVPANGQALNNPHFTQPGPIRHMLVIRGYDGAIKEFITNDPGIAQGESYRYPEDVFYNAIRDYPSGKNLPITGVNKIAISVSK